MFGLVVKHFAAGAKGSEGPGFNSPAAQSHLRFNSPASTLAGKRRAVRLQQTVIAYAVKLTHVVWYLGSRLSVR